MLTLDVISTTGREVITPAQSRAARAMVGLDQKELAGRAHISDSTLRNFEAGRKIPGHNNLAAIQRALEAAGVEFTADGGVRPLWA